MAFVKTFNSCFFLAQPRPISICPQRTPRTSCSPLFCTSPIQCKAEASGSEFDVADDVTDVEINNRTNDYQSTDPTVFPHSNSASSDTLHSKRAGKKSDLDSKPSVNADYDSSEFVETLRGSLDSATSMPTDLGGDVVINDDIETEAEVCIGEFMYSESLSQYIENRKSGNLKPSKSHDSEWIDTWALGVGALKGIEMKRLYARVGILIEENFDDFVAAEGCNEAYQNATIEEIAMLKAREVHESTGGLPCITEMTEMSIDPPESGSRINKSLQQGYYTKDLNEQASMMIEKLKPISEENRMIRFRTVAVYYDGENQFATEKKVNVAMIFAELDKAIISISGALDDMFQKLSKQFALAFTTEAVGGHGKSVNQNLLLGIDGKRDGKVLIGATLLRERIMREGKVLGDGIIKVSSFLNHMVDTDLMEVCGIELAERLRKTMPNKVLTVESTGLIVGLPTAKTLRIPLVFARKSRPITISDSYQTTYRSSTKGTTSELIVSCEYLESGDRVIIIDDFLAGGSTAEGLFKLARMAHAKVVGVGVLIEKISDGGRTFLSGYDVPVESLAKVNTDTSGGIQVLEEEPWKPANLTKRNEEKLKEQTLRAKAKFYARTQESGIPVPVDESIDGVKGEQSEAGNDDSVEEEDEINVIGWEDDDLLDEIEDELVQEGDRF